MRRMQRLVVAGTLLASTLGPGVVGRVRADGTTAPTAETRLITTSGEASVCVVPDEVDLVLGIQSTAGDLATAKADNDAKVKKVLALAGPYKIAPQHVQTDNLSIEILYDTESSTYHDTPTGYRVTNSIAFVIADPTQVAGLIGDAIKAGVNQIDSVQFKTTQLRKYRDQAREMAIKAAQDKAVDLAKQLGDTVGKPTNITEGYSGGGFGSWDNNGNYQTQNVVQEVGGGGGGAVDDTLALGEVQVSASVSVTFDLQ